MKSKVSKTQVINIKSLKAKMAKKGKLSIQDQKALLYEIEHNCPASVNISVNNDLPEGIFSVNNFQPIKTTYNIHIQTRDGQLLEFDKMRFINKDDKCLNC